MSRDPEIAEFQSKLIELLTDGVSRIMGERRLAVSVASVVSSMDAQGRWSVDVVANGLPLWMQHALLAEGLEVVQGVADESYARGDEDE